MTKTTQFLPIPAGIVVPAGTELHWSAMVQYEMGKDAPHSGSFIVKEDRLIDDLIKQYENDDFGHYDWRSTGVEFYIERERVIVFLSNGKKVANFSSPHPFTFEDGTVLPAVSDLEAKILKVTFIETDMGDGDIALSFGLSDELLHEMNQWRELHSNNQVDVVIVPLPMLTAIKELWDITWIKASPFRSIRVEDRIKKLVSIHKQCI